MKALAWHGKHDLRCESVPDPKIEHPRDAVMDGDGDVVTGWQNKLQSATSLILPAGVTAEQHRKMAAPGTAE
jgi:hypothetical protein